jgi:hypothetical protein
MIAWEEVETRVQENGLVRFDHPAFRSSSFERLVSTSLAELAGYKTRQSPTGSMAANPASQAEQYLRLEPSGTSPSRPQASQNFMLTTVSAVASASGLWRACMWFGVLSIALGVILGFSQGAN